MTAWPSIVWEAELLRELDARARSEIEAAGALETLREGAAIFRAGDPADVLYVVSTGAIEVRAVRRGDDFASALRKARPGDAFGEEAVLGLGATRRSEAHAAQTSVVARVPGAILRRALAREDVRGAAARVERTVRRAVTLDLIRTMRFARTLPERDVAKLVAATEHVELARGDTLFRQGDPATHGYVVASGMLQLQTEDLGRMHVRAYVSEGDFVGDEEIAEDAPRRHTAVASGATWLLAIPRASLRDVMHRHAAAFEDARRVRIEASPLLDLGLGAHTTQHVFRDVYRLHVARSLLVIDQDACVRCGHCAWSCGASHDDGVSRLTRRGDKLLVGASAGSAPLLVPSSCQHCENPSCMPDCPTGAIGRDLRGEVFIREDLCTGCGSCAKGCPWDNIQLAPRSAGGASKIAKPKRALSAEVAVKCDLCAGVDGGPACVSACPAEAIARIDPRAAVAPSTSASGRAPLTLVPRAASMTPWIAMGIGIAAFLARWIPRRPIASGTVCGVLFALLVAYALVKRLPAARRAHRGLRPWLVAHVTIGASTVGATFAHAGSRIPPNIAGALYFAMIGALVTGAFGALAYRLLPARLTRIEQGGALPEDLAARGRALEEHAFAELTGKSALLKTVYARILRPYGRNPLGAFILLARGRTIRAEEDALRARVDSAMGRSASTLEGAADLVRAVVARRAISAQRILQGTLRDWLPLHVVLTAIAIVLLVAHVAIALVFR